MCSYIHAGGWPDGAGKKADGSSDGTFFDYGSVNSLEEQMKVRMFVVYVSTEERCILYTYVR